MGAVVGALVDELPLLPPPPLQSPPPQHRSRRLKEFNRCKHVAFAHLWVGTMPAACQPRGADALTTDNDNDKSSKQEDADKPVILPLLSCVPMLCSVITRRKAQGARRRRILF